MDVASLWPVWAALFGGAFVVLASVGLFAWLGQRPKPPEAPAPAERKRLYDEAIELDRFAGAAIEKATRAQELAEAARARCTAAGQVRETAWQTHDAAQRAHALARQEATTRAPAPPDDEESERTHEVSSAALAAYRRGDLSVEELREVFRRTGGWDDRQDERDHTVSRARAEEHRAQRAYDLAAAGERTVCREAEIAEVAARALADEAAEAREEALAARAVAEESFRLATRQKRDKRRSK